MICIDSSSSEKEGINTEKNSIVILIDYRQQIKVINSRLLTEKFNTPALYDYMWAKSRRAG